ncbi:MAG: preprotein translocase subunit YajC [Bacillota bacterium]
MFEGGSWPILVIMGVFFVLMIVMTIVPQRKQKKKMAEMLSSLTVGDKVMTIGGFVGVIVSVEADNDRYVLNLGTEESPVNVTVIKNAIRSKLDN